MMVEADLGDCLDGSPVLARMGRELAALAHTVDQLQVVLSDQLLSLATTNPDLMHAFQDVDALAQILANLGRFADTLAQGDATLDEQALYRALGTISVDALRRRLSAEPETFHQIDDDLDLF